jgi:hypothetical protein
MDINAKQLEALDFNYLNQAETFQYSSHPAAGRTAVAGAYQALRHQHLG